MHPLTDTEVYQETHYYPFGMTMEGEWQNIVNGPENNYLYNGKELNKDFDLNWSDYGARYYDAAIGRWNGVDPLAEKYSPFSPYNYVLNNPIKYIDPDGKRVKIKGTFKERRQIRKIIRKLKKQSSAFKSMYKDLKRGRDENGRKVTHIIQAHSGSKNRNATKNRDGGNTIMDENPARLARVEEEGGAGIGTGSLTFFNPNKPSSQGDSNGFSLAHELWHARDKQKGELSGRYMEQANQGEPRMSIKEYRAVQFENVVRKQAGARLRDTYTFKGRGTVTGLNLSPSHDYSKGLPSLPLTSNIENQ